jgi:hypothetical protein
MAEEEASQQRAGGILGIVVKSDVHPDCSCGDSW